MGLSVRVEWMLLVSVVPARAIESVVELSLLVGGRGALDDTQKLSMRRSRMSLEYTQAHGCSLVRNLRISGI